MARPVKALVHFDRNGFGYTLDRTNGTLLVAEPFVYVNWAKGIDKKTGRPIEDPTKRTKQGDRHEGNLSLCYGRQGPAALRLFSSHRPVLRAHQQHVYEL
jgi:hypothetical protein